MKKFYYLIKKEIRDLFFSRASFIFLIIYSFILGYGFYSAVDIYSKASVAAINNPLYSSGFEPSQGIFVPALGSLFLIFSLFFPFLIIPLIIFEKEQNTITLLLQIPFSFNEIVISKLIASILFLFLLLLMILPAIVIWYYLGGHIPSNEIILLFLGYFLYGLFVVTVSLFSGSLFKTIGSASIFAIFIIMISWLIDFGKEMNVAPFAIFLSNYTVTKMLSYFEKGIFSLSAIIYFLTICLFFILLTLSLIQIKLNFKLLSTAVVIIFLGAFSIFETSFNFDITESHRNSFSNAIVANLRKVPLIEIDIYLRKNDSRYKDYENSFLQKLLLVKRDVKVVFMKDKELEENYGKFVYKINGRKAFTYSNSEEEIFPIIFKLANIKTSKPSNISNFPGYPLVVPKSRELIINYTYYILIPIIFTLIYLFKRRMRKW